jgi:peptide/nickel transport system ATP-binding protein
MTDDPTVLSVRHLSVTYGVGPGSVPAVVDVDLSLRRGEILGLAGESGSGKSTLATAVTRILRPPGCVTSGEVRFAPRVGADGHQPPEVDLLGLDAAQLRLFRWRHISVVFQSAMSALNPVLRVRTQLTDLLVAHMHEMKGAAARRRADELLDLVRVGRDKGMQYPHELSGGMRQRVMLAMAMAFDPEVVVMDEPTTALDVVVQREVLEEVLRLRDELGIAVLFITHDLSLLLEIADTIAIMYAGRIVEAGPAELIYGSPQHPYTRGLLQSFPRLRGPRSPLAGVRGSPPDPRELPAGCAFQPRCDHALARCTEAVPLLVDAGLPPRGVACWLYERAEAPVASQATPAVGGAP